MPWVGANYRVADDYRYRAIGGMSSGGFCAMDQGLRHLDLYGTILAVMPYDEPDADQVRDPARRAQYNVTDYLKTMQFPQPVSVFMAYGSEDSEVQQPTHDMEAGLQARGQEVVVEVGEGQDHTWIEANLALPDALLFWEKSMAAATP